MEARPQDVFRSLRGRLIGAYPALVSAAACALLVLLLWPAAPRVYVAEALAVAGGSGQPEAAPADALRWLNSDGVLQAAVANLRREQPRALAAAVAESGGGDPIAAVRSRLQIVRLSGPDELPRLAIAAEAPSRRWTLSLVGELARQLRDHYAAQRKQERLADLANRERTAHDELAQARAARQRMEIQLAGLRHAQLTSTVAASGAEKAAPGASGAAAPASQLSKTLAAMKVERDRLLEIYLPAHPQVQTLSAQIARLEETLRDTTGSSAENWEETSVLETRDDKRKVLLEWRRGRDSRLALAAGQETEPEQDRAAELAEAIGQAQLDLLAAGHRAQAAEHAWQQLQQERLHQEGAGAVHWSVEPARIVSQSGGADSSRQLAAALVAATLAAASAAWLGRRAARDRPLATLDELQASMAVPVVGTLPGDEEPIAPVKRGEAAGVLRVLTRGSEAVLLTFVLTLLAASALDRGLLADLACDPVATLGELVQRLI